MKQLSPEWHDIRTRLLTGSRVAAAIGKSKWTSRQKLWRQYMGIEPWPEQNDAMLHGITYEPVARAAYEVMTGKFVDLAPLSIHPMVTWLAASPDGFVEDGLIEIKCRHSGIPHTEVPEDYYIQMQLQMSCTGKYWCDFFSWSETEEPYLKRVHYSSSDFDEILKGCREFWWHVKCGIEPKRKRRNENQCAVV